VVAGAGGHPQQSVCVFVGGVCWPFPPRWNLFALALGIWELEFGVQIQGAVRCKSSLNKQLITRLN
jgi:hypothetical protein